ncbi:MAG: hypothetical protein ACREVQ_14765 [Burkholderiales bacterium]
MRLATAIAAALLAAVLVSACGDRQQVSDGTRTYQGKRDTKAWDNEPVGLPLNHAGKWTKGDQASWEQQIKARQLTQNEYQRIGR